MGDEREIEPLGEDEEILAQAEQPRRDTEWELVQRAQVGDRSSFEKLYRLNAGMVYALALRLTRRPPEAEEMTQEVFVRAWQKIDTFRTPGHFGAWLRRVAVNLAISSRRATARRGATLPLFEDYLAPQTTRPPTPAAAAQLDLERAIAKLPDGARTVFVLHDVHGYRHNEIAEMTGAAEGTSKAQLHRARRRLREFLER